jgi:hypothetical protein
MSKGVNRPTTIAGDDLEVVRRLRSWFGEDQFVGVLAGDAVSSLIAFGPQTTDEWGARIFPVLDRWWVDGRPMTERDVVRSLHRESALLTALDLIETDGDNWGAGPSSSSLLVRATSLAAHWTCRNR